MAEECGWDLRVSAGVATVFGRGDAPEIAAFNTTLNTVACALRILGGNGSSDVRRAKALGILANPQAAIALVESVEQARRVVPDAINGMDVSDAHCLSGCDASAAMASLSAAGPASVSAKDRRRCNLGRRPCTCMCPATV